MQNSVKHVLILELGLIVAVKKGISKVMGANLVNISAGRVKANLNVLAALVIDKELNVYVEMAIMKINSQNSAKLVLVLV